jgi:hypothetical protein
VKLLKNHIRLERSWIDDKRHLRYRIDSKIDKWDNKDEEKWKSEKTWDSVQSINKRLRIIEDQVLVELITVEFLLTDERMSC